MKHTTKNSVLSALWGVQNIKTTALGSRQLSRSWWPAQAASERWGGLWSIRWQKIYFIFRKDERRTIGLKTYISVMFDLCKVSEEIDLNIIQGCGKQDWGLKRLHSLSWIYLFNKIKIPESSTYSKIRTHKNRRLNQQSTVTCHVMTFQLTLDWIGTVMVSWGCTM